MPRRSLKILLSLVLLAVVAVYAYRWFTPDSAAELARTGQCVQYRQADQRLEAGLDSGVAADPNEIAMVIDACERQGR